MIPISPLVQALLLWTVVVPLVVSVPLALVGWWIRKTTRTGRLPELALASLGGAFLACFIGIRGWPGFPPGPAFDWLFYLAILTAAGEGGLRVFRTRPAAMLLRGLVVGAGIFACIAPVWPQAGSHAVSVGQGVLFGGTVLLILFGTVRSTRRTPSPVLPLSFVLVSVGAAAVFGGSGSLSLAQLAGSLGAGLLPFFVVRFGDHGLDFHAPLVFLVIMLGFLSLQAWLYSDTPIGSLLLLGAASLPVGILSRRWLHERASWLPAALCLGATVLLLAASVSITLLPSPNGGSTAESTSDSGSYRPYR